MVGSNIHCCEECGSIYSRKDHLNRHIQLKHPNVEVQVKKRTRHEDPVTARREFLRNYYIKRKQSRTSSTVFASGQNGETHDILENSAGQSFVDESLITPNVFISTPENDLTVSNEEKRTHTFASIDEGHETSEGIQSERGAILHFTQLLIERDETIANLHRELTSLVQSYKNEISNIREALNSQRENTSRHLSEYQQRHINTISDLMERFDQYKKNNEYKLFLENETLHYQRKKNGRTFKDSGRTCHRMDSMRRCTG